MTMPLTSDRSERGIAGAVRAVIDVMECFPYWLFAFITRLSIAAVFWQSGRTKLEGWRISASTIELFRSEYKLPLINPTIAAHLAAFAEHFFPFLLVIGFATRFSALALLVMTLIIEIFVYPDAWPTHGTWVACFIILMMRGPGCLSLDYLIARRER